jgi:voltage-gated potassium channel
MRKWQHKLHEIIYEADTFAGKLFDILLLFIILFSVLLVSLESIASIDQVYHEYLNIAEWIITVLFTLEYIARILSVTHPLKSLIYYPLYLNTFH